MSRFPAIPADQLTDQQKLIVDGAADVFARVPPQVEWQNSSGVILGPYSPLFYTPELADPWFKLAFAVTRQQRFTIKEKELTILAVLSQYDAPYVLYAHSEIAHAAGLSKEQVQQAVHAQVPDGLEEREAVVYSLALKLAKLHHPMDDASFEQARKVLGRDGIAGLAHIVSGFIYVSMLTNISDGDVPPTKEGGFTATKNPELER